MTSTTVPADVLATFDRLHADRTQLAARRDEVAKELGLLDQRIERLDLTINGLAAEYGLTQQDNEWPDSTEEVALAAFRQLPAGPHRAEDLLAVVPASHPLFRRAKDPDKAMRGGLRRCLDRGLVERVSPGLYKLSA